MKGLGTCHVVRDKLKSFPHNEYIFCLFYVFEMNFARLVEVYAGCDLKI